MFSYFYASTVDSKGRAHQYKLSLGEGVPNGHEIVGLSVAGYFPAAELVDPEQLAALTRAFPQVKRNRGKRAKAQ
jgi:hypothetical protein